MDFRRARPRHSVPRIEWRRVIYHARGASRNVESKLHARRGLRPPFSGRARLVRRRPVPAHLKRRTKRAESGSKHNTGAIGIRQVLREEIVFCGGAATAVSDLIPGEIVPERFVEVPPAARSKAPEESPPHGGT